MDESVQVVVLVGTGWSYMTPFLRDREKRILMVVIPLQVPHALHWCSYTTETLVGMAVWASNHCVT